MFFMLFPFFMFSQKFDKQEREHIKSGNIYGQMDVIQSDNERELKILKSPSKDINPRTKDLDILISRMYLAVTHPTEGGVGIAAPQVGINRNVIWVQRFDKEPQPFEVYINPRIVWRSKLMQKGSEGCLSIPDIREDVYRHYAIEIEYQDQKGKKHSEKIEGFTAVIFQHEIDHLHGILFTDRFEEQKSKKFYLINTQVGLYHP